jgi:uncharacterized repeat protein (TIGR01451 family)
MPDYNPNAIWGSKEKKYVYRPPGTQNVPPSGSPPPLGENNGGKGNGGSNFNGGQKSPSFFHRHGLIFFTIGIFVAIGLAAYIYYLLLPAPAPNIAISFSDPSSIIVGQPFPVVITVANDSKSMIQNAQLNIVLPSSSLAFASGTIPTQDVGMVSSGTINPPMTIWLVATGSNGTAGTTQTVSATLTYQVTNAASTTFTTPVASTTLAIGTQSALSLSYNASSSIFSGQNFDITVNYQNNTAQTLQGIQLHMQYPSGTIDGQPPFHFVSSSTTAPTDAGDDTWNLGTLAANATGTLVINGNIVGPANAQYQLAATIGAMFSGQNYPAMSAPASFTVTPSPLSLALTLNNTSTYIAKLGDSLNYTLTYTNNSNVTFKSVNVSATLAGAMYDFPSLQTNGSFNSKSDTIAWSAANALALASLAPGQSGSVTFTINTLAAFPLQLVSKGYSNGDYNLNVTAQAVSPTVIPNAAGTNTTSVTALTSKVAGEITLAANGYYKEVSSSIANTGPYPPTVDQPTEYTIHWDIANYATDATSVTVSAYLQSGTTFTGAATSTGLASTSLPTYNAGTGLVTWTIPFIPATTGVISPSVSAIFQVRNTPAVNQVGQTVTLAGPSTLTATDVYTGAAVTVTAPAITTQLPNDSYANGQTGDVTQ